MKKTTLLILSVLWAIQICISQPLIVQGVKGKLYLNHKVLPKENWYSVGRLYNVSPKEIAPFNNSSINTPLSIGQQLRIPLTETNLSQTGEKSMDESLIPIYHVFQANETFFKISLDFNAVPVSNLESWNNTKKENTKTGMHLIIGFLKVKTALSAFANQAKTDKSFIDNNNEDSGIKSAAENAKENKSGLAPADKKAIVENTNNSSSILNNKPMVKNTNGSHRGGSGGYFFSEFNSGRKSKNGMAGTFKSTSGWQDGKYYALMNNIEVGTIIKVIAPATQKSVYAKVLGQLPEMKESDGLTVRISNAAASELGEPEGKFNVEVNY
jgi:LysM repeat protein